MSMTLEEAIKNREECLRYLEDIGAKATPSCVEAVRWSVKALKALRPITREQVEKMKASVTDVDDDDPLCDYGHCTACGAYIVVDNFCSVCGSPLTDEAVDLLAKRLEEVLKDGSTTD